MAPDEERLMRLTAALALPLILSLAACGGGKPKGVVRFTGLAPNSSAQKAKDTRTVARSRSPSAPSTAAPRAASRS